MVCHLYCEQTTSMKELCILCIDNNVVYVLTVLNYLSVIGFYDQ